MKEKDTRLRVAAYCRVSTSRDMQDGSFETQMSYYREYIEGHPDMILVGLYGDQGKSGLTMKKRPELNRLLKDCEDGKIDLILTKSVSRFARNLSECVSTVRKLKQQQVTVYFEKENLDTSDERNELLLSILATMAQEESISISQNMRWSKKRRYEMGQPPDVPSYAYRSVGSDHKWVVVESQARRVRLAFYLAGIGTKYPEIREALNALEKAEDTGRVWNHTSLLKLLTHLSYIGDYLSNRECSIATEEGAKRVKNRGYVDQFYMEGHHEPLVSRELFWGVRALIERHLLSARKSKYSEEDLRLMEYCRELAEKERNAEEGGNEIGKDSGGSACEKAESGRKE